MNQIQFTIIALLSVSSIGCATCRDSVVDSVQQGDWMAEVGYRVCGSYSGLNVSVYRVENGPLKAGEGAKEPFKAVIRSSEPYMFDVSPVRIEWIGERRLLVRHSTRNGLDDLPTRLMVIKADRSYKDVYLDYVPEPVIWE